MRQTAAIMGLTNSLDIPGCDDQSVFDKVFDKLREIDNRFSPFKVNSELCRFQSGEISENELSSQMRYVMAACRQAEAETNGYFSAWYGGVYDPTGYVKGWAMAKAGKLIKKLGFGTFCLGSGGDIIAASAGNKTWKIGIQDPKAGQDILNMLSISNGAVATSGTYERGKHIINPKNGRPANELLSLTVIGPDIIKADVLATAGFVLGLKGLGLIERSGYEAFAVDNNGGIFMTAGLSNYSPESSRP